MQQINPVSTNRYPPLLQTGFRPFFLGAMLFAVVSMSIWTLQLYFHWESPLETVTRAQWHGHEMIFGYIMAVIAGFLLTAVQNWTGEKTVDGHRLFVVFLFWLVSRLLALSPSEITMPVLLAASCLFYAALIASIVRPIRKKGNNKQWGIIGKLVLLWVLDVLFISTVYGWIDARYASPVLLIAVYTVVGLVLVMAQRVVASFIRNAIRNRENVREWKIIAILSMVFFLAFVVADLLHMDRLRFVSGAAFALVNVVRLWGWHDREIWSKSLLWVLYAALVFIVAGVLMRSLSPWLPLIPTLGLHAMTYGGIGVVTVGMMARVALGHTGRDVFNPPAGLNLVFLLMLTGALFRSVVPAFWMDYYFHFILVSQIAWIGAFLLLLVYYFLPLVQPRPDGRYG